jgi:hypothetical protein
VCNLGIRFFLGRALLRLSPDRSSTVQKVNILVLNDL